MSAMLSLRRLLLKFRALPPIQQCMPVIILLGILWFILSSSSSKQSYALPIEHTCHDPSSAIPLPQPLIIMVAGGARTGTTYVYNLVRILLRQRDPNTISGWYEDLSYAASRYASPNPPMSPVSMGYKQDNYNAWNGALDAYNQTGTTVVVKVHSLAHATRVFTGCDDSSGGEIGAKSCPVDLVILTHRNVRSQVSSLRRMGWAKQLSPSKLRDSYEFCRKRRDPTIEIAKPRLLYEEWSRVETWVTQAQALVMCHMEWLKAVGTTKLAVDVKMEGTLDGDVAARVTLAQHIIKQICGYTQCTRLNRMNAEAAVEEADLLRPLSCSSWQAVNPITHYHRGHLSSTKNAVSNEADQDQERGLAAIAADPLVQKLLHDRG